MTAYGDGTRAVRAGLPEPVPGQPFLPGPVFAAPYHLDPVRGAREGLDGYGRTDNPTWRALESAIGELEGGECVVFSSGMAAITALLLTTLRPGDTVMLPSDGYYHTRAFATETLRRLGIRIVETPTAGPYPSLDGVALILVETPANPGLDVCDIAALAREAHANGALLAVDSTAATPLGQQPLALGADVVVASGTKALTGHSDLVLGYVVSAEVSAVRRWRDGAGAVPGPFEAWLAHRSLSTLDVRLARQTANAKAIADLLASRPEVTSVRWPGREGDPAYAVARRQMRRIPGIVTFTLPDAAYVARFLGAARLISPATSFGGPHTTADRRAQWGDPVPEGLVRLSCGIEDTDDLVADISRALDSAGAGRVSAGESPTPPPERAT
jgi:cystathionine gamma-lyase